MEEDPPGAVGFSAGGSIHYTLTYAFSTVGVTTFVETFDEGSNQGAWSWGTGNESISPLNGNPGAFLQDLTLSSCCPAASTSFGDTSAFTGNYRARGVSSVGIDLITLDASFGVGGRPLSVILVNDNGTPGNFEDDSGAFFVGDTNIPDPGVPGLTPPGWTPFDFEIPAGAVTLPPGWQTFDENGLGASDSTWNAVIVDVDHQYRSSTTLYILETMTTNFGKCTTGVLEDPSAVSSTRRLDEIIVAIIVDVRERRTVAVNFASSPNCIVEHSGRVLPVGQPLR